MLKKSSLVSLQQCSNNPSFRLRAVTSRTSPSSPLLRKSRFTNQNHYQESCNTQILLLFSARRTLPRSARSLLVRAPSGTPSSSATPPLSRSALFKVWLLGSFTLHLQVCNGQGPDECRTEYETSCTTRFLRQTSSISGS